MSDLGNVFDAVTPGVDVPRGPDLRVSVTVPRTALGRSEGFVADIPDAIEHEGVLVPRAPSDDRSRGVVLHLAAGLPDRALLRLRGQGGVHPDGTPGDLLVDVTIVDPPPRALALPIAILVAVLVMAAILAFVALR